MDTSAVGQTDDWKNTKEAVANFRRLLLCSKCSQLLKDPVCLGTCEHILCRSCAGPQAGEGCVVCRRPSWVKDIQINRQLNSIIQLFCGLESMLNLDGLPVTRAQKAGPVLKHKKNFKIWFSPRSRKVRCMVEKPPKVFIPDTKSLEKAAEPQPHDPVAEVTDLTVFNFTSSSQESDTASPTSRNINQNRKRTNGKIGSRKKTMKRSSKKQRRQMVKKKLDAVNKQWRITEVESTLVESEHLAEEFESRSKRRVSFLSPDVLADIHGLSMASNSPKCSFPAPFIPTLLCQNESDSFHYDPLPACDSTTPKKQATLYSPQHSPKLEGEAITLETTPKRPTASLSRGLKSLGHLSPAAINSSPSSRCNKIPQENGGESPPVPSIVGQKSPSPRASLGRCNSRSPAVVKKNHKGETPLHLAAIKGDVEDVKELLDLGADPNLKDNAGWTPLHEACNLGHLVVVKVLLSRGALLNTPGYENDSPLHDAVRNGHIAIVKLLLQFGASQSVLNLHGKRPADYAGSQEMLEVFQETPEEAQNGNTSITSPSSLSAVDSFAKQEEIVLFLSSKLSQTDQHQCAKLSRLLEGRITDSFTVSVSHIVVPEGPLPSTYSTLLGLLAGCWIVKYSCYFRALSLCHTINLSDSYIGLVCDCDTQESTRLRVSGITDDQKLPPLFDGCFFFLLGSFKSPTKDKLAKLVRAGGGQLLSRQPKPDSDVTQTLSAAAYHALPGSDQALCTQYIIFDHQGPRKPAVLRRGKVWSAPSTWIIDCIVAYRLLPVPNLQSV